MCVCMYILYLKRNVDTEFVWPANKDCLVIVLFNSTLFLSNGVGENKIGIRMGPFFFFFCFFHFFTYFFHFNYKLKFCFVLQQNWLIWGIEKDIVRWILSKDFLHVIKLCSLVNFFFIYFFEGFTMNFVKAFCYCWLFVLCCLSIQLGDLALDNGCSILIFK